MLEVPIDIDDLDGFSDTSDSNYDAASGEEGVVVVRQGIIQKSNDGMVRLSGYGHEEVVDTIFASFFHLDDIPLVESICDPPNASDNGEPRPVVRLIMKNGKSIPVRISVGSQGKDIASWRRIKIRNLRAD